MLRLFRCEVDPDCAYHCDALAGRFPEADEYDLTTRGADGALDGVDAAVLSGSTTGVYEGDEHGWIEDARDVVRELVERRVSTLGVCFGHQLVNDVFEPRSKARRTASDGRTRWTGRTPGRPRGAGGGRVRRRSAVRGCPARRHRGPR